MMTSVDPSILKHFGNEYQGFPLLLQALGEKQWLIVLQAEPTCRLRLSVESDLTKQLDRMGLSDETKIGDAELDETYVIRAESPEARALLQQPEVLAALRQLSPFTELELTHKEYRLITEGLSPTPAALEGVLGHLGQLLRATRAPEGSVE